MIAARTKAHSAPRPHRSPSPRNEAHELHIRVVGHDPRIANHLQLTASALAMEARRTDDLRLARILLDACARVTAVAQALEALRALDLDDEVEVAGKLPAICDALRARLWGDPAEAAAEREGRELSFAAGELVATAIQEGAHDHCVCVRLEQGGAGRQLSVVPGGGQADNAGLRMLRAFAARFGSSLQSVLLPHGASISVRIE